MGKTSSLAPGLGIQTAGPMVAMVGWGQDYGHGFICIGKAVRRAGPVVRDSRQDHHQSGFTGQL